MWPLWLNNGFIKLEARLYLWQWALGFEKDLIDSTKKIQAQDPLEEVYLGDKVVKIPSYIIVKVKPNMKKKVVEFLKEYKHCFTWDYNEMSWLSWDMVELKLPIWPGKKPVKQLPRRFAPKIMSKIK